MTQKKLLGKHVKIPLDDGTAREAMVLDYYYHQELHKTILKLVSAYGHEFTATIDEVRFV